jgi:hypothetical protein
LFKLISVVLVSILSFVIFACEKVLEDSEPQIWSTTFGSTESEGGRSVQQTSDGGYAITGYKSSYENGWSVNVWLIKTRSNGSEEWNKTFGGSSETRGLSLQQTSDGGYIITGTISSSGTSDVLLLKTNSNGTEEWNKTFGNGWRNRGNSVQQTWDGGFIITGYTDTGYNDYISGRYNQNVWLIKTSADGIEEWSKSFGGSGEEWGYSVQQTLDGGYIITGHTDSLTNYQTMDVLLIKTSPDGTEEWKKTFGDSSYDYGRSVQQTLDGGYIITGANHLSDDDYRTDLWLIKTNADGTEEWNKTFAVGMQNEGRAVQQTSDGGFIIAGTSGTPFGDYDVLLIKTNEDGTEEWSKTIGGSEEDEAESVQETSDGGYIITGTTRSFGNGHEEVWLIKTDSEGNTSLPDE